MCVVVKAKVLDSDQLEFKSQLHLLLAGEFCFLNGEDSVFLTPQSGHSDMRQCRAGLTPALGRRELLLRVGVAEAGVILFYFIFLLFWLHHAACGILVPQSGAELLSLSVPSPNHWTTRESPGVVLIFIEICKIYNIRALLVKNK